MKTTRGLTFKTPFPVCFGSSVLSQIGAGVRQPRFWKQRKGGLKWSPRRLGSELILPATYEGRIRDAASSKDEFAIVAAKFNSLVTKQLVDGALKAFEDNGVYSTQANVSWSDQYF